MIHKEHLEKDRVVEFFYTVISAVLVLSVGYFLTIREQLIQSCTLKTKNEKKNSLISMVCAFSHFLWF